MLYGGIWLVVVLVWIGVFCDLLCYVGWLCCWSEWFMCWGSDVGCMMVELSGEDVFGCLFCVWWWLEVVVGEGLEVLVMLVLVLV